MSKEIKVYSPTGDYIRTFSEKMHGKDYKELAKGLASKVEGRTLVEDAEIKEVKKEEPKEEQKEPVETKEETPKKKGK